TVRALLPQGADVNAAQGDGMTALHWAAERGDTEIAEMLVYAGANAEATTRIGAYTPLHVASRAGNAAVVELLLTYGGSPDIPTSTTGAMPLHLAAASGNVDVVRLLLERGADANAREAEWRQTPLVFAAAQNRAEAIAVLLDAGADPSIASRVLDPEWFYAMGGAADDRQRKVLEAFSAGGWEKITPAQMQMAVLAARDLFLAGELPPAEAEEEDEVASFRRPPTISRGGLTALLHATRQGHIESVRALLDGGADVDQPSAGDATTSLLMATINGQFDVAMLLLERGADPNLKADENGVAPLWAAVNAQWQPRTRFPQPQEMSLQQTTYLDLMAALLDAGADPDARIDKHPWYMVYTGCGNGNCGLVNTEGSTAFWRAAYATDIEAMRLLVTYGADENLPTLAPEPRRRRGAGGQSGGPPGQRPRRPGTVGNFFRVGSGSEAEASRAGEPEPVDPSGLPPVPVGGPGVFAIHAASGVGYGTGFAGNAHRHAPDAWLSVVRYLIEELDADLDARDYNGYTALHHAASRGDNEMILYLIENGADVTVVSRRGQTAADMANGPVSRISPFPDAVALLERLGSKNNHNCVSC
ncbi:MAG: ankyrin repeat domain-containing protein, partial [Acidobacteria bacterium]|nr:ankyrin repeat domain-containing protein [Acidobacteriota bacterium]